MACIDPPTYEYIYIYEPYGKIIEAKVIQLFPGVDAVGVGIFKGNYTGKVVDVCTYKYNYSYNNKGQLEYERCYNMRGESGLESYIKFVYDIKGNVKQVSCHNSEGVYFYAKEYVYNAQGFVSQSWHSEDLKSHRVWSVYVYGK